MTLLVRMFLIILKVRNFRVPDDFVSKNVPDDLESNKHTEDMPDVFASTVSILLDDLPSKEHNDAHVPDDLESKERT